VQCHIFKGFGNSTINSKLANLANCNIYKSNVRFLVK